MEKLMELNRSRLEHATMEWGIKESFRSYFERLPDHTYGLSEGARHCSDGQIEFQALPSAAATGTFAFRGVVELRAHHGALSVRIADPRIRLLDESTATLSAEVDSVDGEPVRMDIANLSLEDQEPGQQLSLRFGAALAEEGQYLFMGNYFAGDPMDPVTIWFTTS